MLNSIHFFQQCMNTKFILIMIILWDYSVLNVTFNDYNATVTVVKSHSPFICRCNIKNVIDFNKLSLVPEN